MLRMLALLCLVLLSSLALTAENPPADLVEVRGVVVDEAGQPVAGAAVTAVSEPFDRIQTRTDDQGRFLFDCAIAYGNTRAAAVFAVAPVGEVEMVDDVSFMTMDGLVPPLHPYLMLEPKQEYDANVATGQHAVVSPPLLVTPAEEDGDDVHLET